MKRSLIHGLVPILVFVGGALWLAGCGGVFFDDGAEDVGMSERGGYFFLVENETQRIIMLDRNLAERGSWAFSTFTSEDFIQGVTCDDATLWVAAAGDADAIYRLDLSAGDDPVVLRTLKAPPEGQGTVRDIAWDGTHLWVINAGSVTYSTPPELFRIDPVTGDILARHVLPSAEPRGLCHVGPNAGDYGESAAIGLYYTDKDDNFIYIFSTERSLWRDGFAAPVPPRGQPAGVSYIFPAGIHFDGDNFWIVNSSGPADHLFLLDRTGVERQRFDLPYERPGAVVWSPRNLATPAPPAVTEVFPNLGSPGQSRTVAVSGSGFREGLAVSFGAGVAVVATTREDADHLTVVVEIDAAAEAGPRDVTVTNPDGQQGVGRGLFRVVADDDPSLGSLWLADLGTGALRRYSIIDRAWRESYSSTSISTASQQGLTFDGEMLWLSFSLPDRLLARVDTTGGTLSLVRDLSARPTGTVRDLTWDGQHLWVANQSTTTPDWNVIDRVDPVTGEILETVPAPRTAGGLRGIVWADGNLYANDKDADSVYVWRPDVEKWQAAFAAPLPPGGGQDVVFPTGMTWDGVSFWMCNSSGDYDYIFQVSPDGTVLGTVEVPNRGSAQPTGLVYTPAPQP